jgi:hypothetical protein
MGADSAMRGGLEVSIMMEDSAPVRSSGKWEEGCVRGQMNQRGGEF